MRQLQKVLEVSGLAKAYRRRPILRGVSIDVGPGEAIAIIGPNGAGKSTFLGCLTGERVPDSGTILIAGNDPFRDPAGTARELGFVPEQPFLYGELTITETLRFVSEARGLDRETSDAEAARLLDIFGLLGSEGFLCRELSQGMGRKVAIIIALLHRPSLLVLDEVFNGLDLPSIERLLHEIESHRARGGAVMLSSHDLELLGNICDRGLLLGADGARVLEGAEWQRWKVAPTLLTSSGTR
jgi:ABC-2 type transport system ATP-binding protein